MKNENMRWILLGAIILIFISMQNTLPKEAVSDIEGKPCSTNEDCPCMGEVDSTKAVGIGTGECVEGTCDMSHCIDLEPISDWLKENPLSWMKENMILTIFLIGGILMVIFWPKV